MGDEMKETYWLDVGNDVRSKFLERTIQDMYDGQ